MYRLKNERGFIRRLKASTLSICGRAIYGIGLHKIILKKSAVVVAFHSVNDEATDSSINCSPREFERYCRFFARKFEVVSMTEIVRKLKSGINLNGELVITFDDGYKDNREQAAPVLLKSGLAATFFVTTDFIGSTFQPLWAKDMGFHCDWMTWSDVRELADLGFEIGAHTMTHMDLAVADDPEVLKEVMSSRDAIAEKIGIVPTHFAYPFGGEDQISSSARRIIEENGFESCLSCHGGLVESQDNPYFIRRQPVSPWYCDEYHFGFEILREHWSGRKKARQSN